MKLSCLWVSGRAATVLIEDGGTYQTLRPYHLVLNGQPAGEADLCVTSLYDLWPDTQYALRLYHQDECVGTLDFHTLCESVTLDVRDFGAKGDGAADDTAALQAAIACCPPDGRVLVPEGRYVTAPLFLKSGLRLELGAGATLALTTDRSRMPMLPGRLERTDERGEHLIGSWEGNPLTSFASLLTGVDARDISVYGRGTLDGQAQEAGWWIDPKHKHGAWRGRMVYLCRCQNVTLQGIQVKNSPSWNLHPYFSQKLRFLNLRIQAPDTSPNTDGIDPESCADMLIAGVRFEVGDDCIAIKSGKLYMGQKYRTPCQRLQIAHCLMDKGHGGVTVGSEMSGGVRDVSVHDCDMRSTDRGLRIKTRRGRGRQAVVDDIVMERVRMRGVRVPFTVNAFYFCDPDGHSERVQTRAPQPVDDGTPSIGLLRFCDIDANGCNCCAGYCLGLPEQKIGRVEMKNVRIQCEEGQPFQPVMADGVDKCAGRGFIMENVNALSLQNVTVSGQAGQALSVSDVDSIEGTVEQ